MIDHYVIILLLWILPSCFLTSRVKPLQFLWGLSFPVSKSKPTETFKGFLYGCLHRRLASRQFGNESPLHILNVKIWAVTNSYKFQKFGSIFWKLLNTPPNKLVKLFRGKRKNAIQVIFIKLLLKICATLLKYTFEEVH